MKSWSMATSTHHSPKLIFYICSIWIDIFTFIPPQCIKQSLGDTQFTTNFPLSLPLRMTSLMNQKLFAAVIEARVENYNENFKGQRQIKKYRDILLFLIAGSNNFFLFLNNFIKQSLTIPIFSLPSVFRWCVFEVTDGRRKTFLCNWVAGYFDTAFPIMPYQLMGQNVKTLVKNTNNACNNIPIHYLERGSLHPSS